MKRSAIRDKKVIGDRGDSTLSESTTWACWIFTSKLGKCKFNALPCGADKSIDLFWVYEVQKFLPRSWILSEDSQHCTRHRLALHLLNATHHHTLKRQSTPSVRIISPRVWNANKRLELGDEKFSTLLIRNSIWWSLSYHMNTWREKKKKKPKKLY